MTLPEFKTYLKTKIAEGTDPERQTAYRDACNFLFECGGGIQGLLKFFPARIDEAKMEAAKHGADPKWAALAEVDRELLDVITGQLRPARQHLTDSYHYGVSEEGEHYGPKQR